MVSKQPYQNLDHALRYFREQVSESIPYALHNMPVLDSPEKIFNYLKPRLTYKKDPKGIELFQTLPTLLENNWHGITGAGDCDCFSIAALSTLLANGFTDSGIVLAGRSPLIPVHIWIYTNVDGQRYDLDLTNKVFNTTRHYGYLQHIPYKLNQKEKAMILELAEGLSGGRRRRGKFHVQGHFRRYPLHEGGAEYFYSPQRGVNVRADVYDHLSSGQFQQMCLSEGVELEEIAELSKGRAQRKADKVARKALKPKNVRKMAKVTGRIDRKQTKADARQIKQQGKADKRTSSGQARIDRANNPNRGQGFKAFTQTVFGPTQPDDSTDQIPGMDPYAAPDPADYMPALYPDDQPQEVEAEEVYQEDEPSYQMAEGFSITKRDVVTGLATLIAGVALDRLVIRPVFGR